MRINATVRYGNERVGMLSLSGIKAGEGCHTRVTDGQVGAPLRPDGRYRFARAAHEPNGDRLSRPARLRAGRPVARGAARGAVHPGAHVGAPLVPAVRPLFR